MPHRHPSDEPTDPAGVTIPRSWRSSLLRALPGAITVLVAVVSSWTTMQQSIGRLDTTVAELRALDLARVAPRLDRVERDAAGNASDIRDIRERVSGHDTRLGIVETTIRAIERSARHQ